MKNFARKQCPTQVHNKLKKLIALFPIDQRTSRSCDTVERKQKPTKLREYGKINIFFENWFTKNKDHLKKKGL